jgi:uncharacterized damage-inducible protein DinB
MPNPPIAETADPRHDYVQRNRVELERLRGLVDRLSDEELARPVNESWTVSGVLGHIAFWDGRALFLADKLLRGEPFTPSDDEPEDVDWINDANRPLIHAVEPRRAAELALQIAQETDERMAALPPELAHKTWPSEPTSPVNPLRAAHRGEHLDEIEASLRD